MWWELFLDAPDTVRSVGGGGEFHCPTCAARRVYELQVHQVKLSFFFVPFMPWGAKRFRVSCATCRSSFEQDTLRQVVAPGPRQTAALRHALRRVALAFMRASGRDPAERRAFQAAYLELMGEPLSEEALDEELARAQADARPLATHLAAAAADLQEAAREGLLKTALAVSAPSGPLTAADSARLLELGAALKMTAAHVGGVLAGAGPGPG